MSTKMRKVKFWGKSSLQCIGMSAVAALLMYLFYGIGPSGYSGNMETMLTEVLSLYPYYLLISGAGLMLILCLSYFQTYFPVFLSMNATRKSVIGGIMGSMAVTGAVLLLTAALIWRLTPGDIAESGWKLLPLFTGLFFGVTAYCITLGVVLIRWRSKGVLLMILNTVVIGVIAGFCYGAASNKNMMEMQFLSLLTAAEGNFLPVTALGIVLYLAAGFFAAVATSKLEVRM